MQAKGTLQIQVDESQLSASLVFTPAVNGQEWDKAKLLDLLEKKKIVEGVDELAVEKALGEFALASEELEEAGDQSAAEANVGEAISRLIARGTAPVAGDTGAFEWKELPVPEEFAADVERVLKTAAAPEITRTRSKKVKVKKKVVKKTKLPFGKPKEEIVENTETQSWEEPVNIDPKVLQSGWAEEGEVLAEWKEGETGTVGKSVYGKPLLWNEDDKEEFFGGRGVKVTKKSVEAEAGGVLRRGKNWVEIIPFSRHDWELGLSKDQATCYIDFNPGASHASPPTAAQIREKAKEIGFPEEELLPEKDISIIVGNAVSAGKTLEKAPISVDRDGSFSVDASDDKLKGLLNAVKGGGRGAPLVLKEVGAAIKNSGFKGMDYEKIKQDLLEFQKGPERELKDYLLAEGKPPAEGEDRTVEYTCPFVEEKELEQLQRVEELGPEILKRYASLGEYPLQTVTKMAAVRKNSVVANLAGSGKGEDGLDVFGAKIEGGKGSDPMVTLLENIERREDEYYALEDGILDVIEGESQEGLTLRVREHVDSVVYVQLAEDNMKAFLTLSPARGTGEALSLEKVNATLDENGVKKGLDSKAITEAIEKAKRGELVEKVPVAEGIPPIDPGTSRLKFHVRRATGKALTLKEDGQADYKNQDKITSVEKDQLIAEIISSDTMPKDGWDVTGKPIKAKEPPPLALDIGKGLRQETQENGDIYLYAENSGEVYYDQRRLEVTSIHTVEGDVGMKSGNIKFPGEVQVKGNVHEGFYVMAGGGVKVAGNAEACLISSGHTVTVMQGIVGANKAAIRAKEHIETTFVEQATLLAVGDVRIKNSCLRCDVKCNGSLQLVGDKGDLVGGKVYTRRGIDAHNIGNDKGAKTTISFGQDYLVADQIEQQEKKIQQIKDYLTKLDGMMNRAEKDGDRKKLDAARQQKLKYMKEIEKRSMHLFSLRERYEEHFESILRVRGTIYPGVILESHGRFYEVSKPKERIAFVFNSTSGRIEEEPLEKAEKAEKAGESGKPDQPEPAGSAEPAAAGAEQAQQPEQPDQPEPEVKTEAPAQTE